VVYKYRNVAGEGAEGAWGREGEDVLSRRVVGNFMFAAKLLMFLSPNRIQHGGGR